MRYWRVIFKEGKVHSVEPIDCGVRGGDWLIVQAPDETTARIAARKLYDSGKKKLAKERNYEAGKCACGRKQDRANPKAKDGRLSKVCTVCSERALVYKDKHAKRVADGTVGQGMAERDEEGRIAKNLERQRDRRGEIRLEVLLEVQNQWIRQRSVRLFGVWIEQEIETLTGARRSGKAVIR